MRDYTHYEKQLKRILETNPMLDDYHVGIRTIKDILTPEQAFGSDDYDNNYLYPDFQPKHGLAALKRGKITVYSSKPIIDGNFVTPSMMQAKEYAGNGRIYSKLVDLDDVAWINSDEGQYAKVR